MAIKFTTTTQSANDTGIKVLVYGEAGAGKTRLCATLPHDKTIILSAEAGLLSLSHVSIPVIEIKSFEALQEAYLFLANDEKGKKFSWICLDSVSEIAEVVLAHELSKVKDPRQAYGELITTMTKTLKAFRDLPSRNVYMTCKIERVKDADGNVMFSPSLPGAKLAQQISYLFDEVLCLRTARDPETQEVQRYLQTAGDYNYIAKDRSGKLDPHGEPADLMVIYNKIVGKPAESAKKQTA